MALGLDRWVPVAVVVAAVAALAAVGRRLGYPLAGALVMLTVGLALVAPQILLAWHRRVLTTARNTCETTLKNRTEALADVERRLEEFRCPAQDRPMCGPKAAAP